MHRCLYCYKELSDEDLTFTAGKNGFHKSCSKKIFGSTIPPELPYSEGDMLQLADKILRSNKVVTGVQPKLSLNLPKQSKGKESRRFTIIGLWGEYILKPPTKTYKNLPEIEDLTMHLAEITGIKTVNHSLIYLKSGQLAYITKRVDRLNGEKLHMEDMCQITERLTEYKYKGSYEQIAKAVLNFSANPGFDVINFYEQVVFSFLTGNNDMHLKNFSLLKHKELSYNLCPAYDMVASALVLKEDSEELALTINGKKKRIKRHDFEIAMQRAGIEEKVIRNIFRKFVKAIPKWHPLIDNSFIPEKIKLEYHKLIDFKSSQINLVL